MTGGHRRARPVAAGWSGGSRPTARVPALSVALHRADRPLWTLHGRRHRHRQRRWAPDTQFRIGSVTKTFTAVLVMQCRDDGLLDLDDPVGPHLDLPAHGELTVRRLLSHTAGLQREPYGDVWDTLRAPDAERVAGRAGPGRAGAARRPPVPLLQPRAWPCSASWSPGCAAAPGRRCSPSGCSTPLGLTDTTVDPGPTGGRRLPGRRVLRRGAPGAADRLRRRSARPPSCGAPRPTWPAGRRSWPIRRRWTRPARCSPPATLDEMRWPLTTTDETLWAAGFGLGLILVPQGDRVVHVGHDGAMPGFLAGVYGRRGGDGTPGAMGCRGARLVRHGGRDCSTCRTGCSPTAGRARPGRHRAVAARRSPLRRHLRRSARPLVGRGLRVRLLLARRHAAGPRARVTRRAARRRSSAPCRTGRTCCGRSPAGRPASCCG